MSAAPRQKQQRSGTIGAPPRHDSRGSPRLALIPSLLYHIRSGIASRNHRGPQRGPFSALFLIRNMKTRQKRRKAARGPQNRQNKNRA